MSRSSADSSPSGPPDIDDASAKKQNRAGATGGIHAASIQDPWAAKGRLLVDGPFEPGSTAQTLLLGLFGLVATFLAFQVIVSPVVMIVLLFVAHGPDAMASLGTNVQALIDSFARELLITNAISQWLAFAIPALLLARLHASDIYAFIRLRKTSILANGLAFAGMVALLPVAQWLAQFNQQLPVPEALRALDEQSMQLIEKVLESDFGLGFGLIMLAVTPAFCEELIFRGYAQRQFERVGDPAVAIAMSGILFGLYHLRMTQLLPLTAIGLYLAYLTWRTGSLWPAIIAHFANNAIIVAFSTLGPSADSSSATVAEGMNVPWYAVVIGLSAFTGIVYAFQRYVRPDQDRPDQDRPDQDRPDQDRQVAEENP